MSIYGHEMDEDWSSDNSMISLARQDFANVKAGDELLRIWGNDYMRTIVRVSAVDDEFVYCDAQRKIESDEWVVLPPDDTHWKFDRGFGVETDEEQGWGIQPYGYKVLTRIVKKGAEVDPANADG